MTPKPPKKREWPKSAAGPLGNRAVFQCAGDVPAGWIVDGMTEPLKRKEPKPEEMDVIITRSGMELRDKPKLYMHEIAEPSAPAPPKNKGGRPKKAAVGE